jgi:hypothetical protein
MRISKNSNKNFQNNAIQFPRLIAELEANGIFTKRVLRSLREQTDLSFAELYSVIDRACNVWDEIKEKTKKG